MTDLEFFLIFGFCTVGGYLTARLVDALRERDARNQRELAARRAFIEAHRPVFLRDTDDRDARA